MKTIYLLAAAMAATFALPASAQSPKLVMDEMKVPSDPGIEIYLRNKRPADMTSFRPERTLLFVHGATYPAHAAFDLALDLLHHRRYLFGRPLSIAASGRCRDYHFKLPLSFRRAAFSGAENQKPPPVTNGKEYAGYLATLQGIQIHGAACLLEARTAPGQQLLCRAHTLAVIVGRRISADNSANPSKGVGANF